MTIRRDDHGVFIELGWVLLEHKWRYYVRGCAIIPDEQYDKLELEYKALAKKLGLTPSVAQTVGFPDSPSGRLVASKMEEIYGKGNEW